MISSARQPFPCQRGAAAPTLVVALVVAAAVAVVAAAAGYWFGKRQGGHAAPGAAPPAAQGAPAATTDAAGNTVLRDDKGRRVLYWHDPMVPGQRFDKPGKSPFMDMQLVPVYADEGSDEGTVKVSPRLAQNFGVRTAEAREGSLATGITAVGAIAVDERTITGVQARVQGFVERLHVRATFDTVRAGQPIAELFVPEWVAAQEEFLALKGSSQPGVAALAEAARNRLRLLGMPDGEIARIEREGRSAGRVTVTAPQGGIVWEIGARDGMAVMPGTNLVRIAGLGSVWLIAEIPEAQAGQIAAGMPVEVRTAAFPERAFNGRVEALLPEVNVATRTVRARIVLANPGGVLKPGMFANASFRGPVAKPAVLVPSEAVIRTGKRNVVIVAAGDGRFAPVEVEVGRESGDQTEIARGISAGQRVVASGQFLIDSEASLKGVLARMNDAGLSAAGGGTAPDMARHKGAGVVRDVDAGEVFIEHGAIESAGMGAMTMGFKAPPGGVPPTVKEGSRVDFEFSITPQGEFALWSIVPAAAGAPARGAAGGRP
jgi:Cu(I)/Ag(I) efflux system membrane fusion protein